MKTLFLVLIAFAYLYPQSGNPIPQRVDSLFTKTSHMVNVEEYGAVGDGVTNDSAAIYNAINNNPNKIISFTRQYYLGGKVHIDLGGENIYLDFSSGAKLISNITDSRGNIYYPDAIFRITNAGDVIVNGLIIEADKTGDLPGLSYNELVVNTNDDTANFLCAFKIDSAETVHLTNIKASNAIYAGIYMSDIDNLYAENCMADSNYYAGMMVRRTKHIVINGGEFSYNGIKAPSYLDTVDYYYGYGLEIGNSFSDVYGRANEEVTITGVKAFHNVRKGIGTHQAYNYIVIGNHVKGFGITGIDGVNSGYEQWVKDVNISNNIIEQDSAWCADNSYTSSHIAIQTGTYAGINDQVDYPIGSVVVTNNILKNLTATGSNYGIQCFASYADNIQIVGNTISNSRFIQAAISVNSGDDEGGQPTNILVSSNTLSDIIVTGATDNNASGIFVTGGKQITISDNIIDALIVTDSANAAIKAFEYGAGADISAVSIKNNFLGGTLRNGIFLYGINSTTISGNLLSGTFTDYYIYTTPEAEQVIQNNSVMDLYTMEGSSAPQSNLLPNILGNGTGNATYTIQTADSTNVTLNTLSLNMLRYEDISAAFNIRVYVASSSNIVNGYMDYYAYAGNADSVISYGVDSLLSVEYINTSIDDFEDYCPIVEWTTIGNEATLRFTFPSAYMDYKIDINFNSRLAVIYRKPE